MDPRHPNYQQDVEREPMEFDVLIVGAGPAGLSAAIRLRQLADERGEDLSVCVIEKGSEVGAHILSGAVMDPRAINELIPDWKDKGAPLNTPVTKDEFLFLTEKKAYKSPVLPPQMQNHGNYIVSLGNVCRWLGEQAEAAGAEVFAGFPGAQILYNDDGSVAGVATGDMGLDAEGKPGPNYEPGVELRARMTLFGEGCRGSLTKELMEKFDLRRDSDPQTYGIGIKELWEVDPAKHEQGKVVHTAGWPMDSATYGGSFIYHLEDNQVAIGFIVGLDYKNPHLSPFEEMQRHKLHPAVRPLFEGARRISYGARALVEGGIQALPKLGAPGALLIGDSAGFLNVPKIKGSHNAIKTGMLAAESAYETLTASGNDATEAYQAAVRGSWVWDELMRARNVRPAFARWGLWGGTLYTGIDTVLFRGKAPWTLRIKHADNETLVPKDQAPKIDYPKPDGKITFDKLSSVFLSSTNHGENQPVHLRLRDESIPVDYNLAQFDAPEQRYCPAGVYEIVRDDDGSNPRLQINAQNCVHCKTCDIKDPKQNINWVTPEGGGGPNYPNM